MAVAETWEEGCRGGMAHSGDHGRAEWLLQDCGGEGHDVWQDDTAAGVCKDIYRGTHVPTGLKTTL